MVWKQYVYGLRMATERTYVDDDNVLLTDSIRFDSLIRRRCCTVRHRMRFCALVRAINVSDLYSCLSVGSVCYSFSTNSHDVDGRGCLHSYFLYTRARILIFSPSTGDYEIPKRKLPSVRSVHVYVTYTPRFLVTYWKFPFGRSWLVTFSFPRAL